MMSFSHVKACGGSSKRDHGILDSRAVSPYRCGDGAIRCL